MSSLSDRDVADGIRRLVLDHGFKQFALEGAPSAAPVGRAILCRARERGPKFFEATLDGRTFLVMVTELST